ncbi:MAG TPA: hypothetical protein VL966_12135 [Alphaproteobacteria bacterium]|jgi:hypothetical protein|nr:hypothetical protein [Alphaproteobacteria bacterium]
MQPYADDDREIESEFDRNTRSKPDIDVTGGQLDTCGALFTDRIRSPASHLAVRKANMHSAFLQRWCAFAQMERLCRLSFMTKLTAEKVATLFREYGQRVALRGGDAYHRARA